MNPQAVGTAIAERRQTLKMSMRDASRNGGISVTAWADLEKGKRPPSLSTQRAVATAIGWRLDWHDVLLKASRPDQQALLSAEVTGPELIDAPPEPVVAAQLGALEAKVSELLDALARSDVKIVAVATAVEANHALLSAMVPVLRALKAESSARSSVPPVQPSGRKRSADPLVPRSGGVRKRAGR